MEMTKIFSMEEIKDMVANAVSGRDIDRVILFGSYAKGEATEQSDIDLLVYGGKSLSAQSFFSFCGQLYMTSKLFKDIFDFNSLSEGSPWISQILREGLIIYEQ